MHIALTPPSMQRACGSLFTRREGAGNAVICLHSSTGSHAQWRSLTTQLGDGCESIAADLHGHGHSPAWPMAAANSLDVDADALWQQWRSGGADRGIHLVGHSYGAAVAMQMALRRPHLVRSLTLYEPVPFGVIGSRAPDDAAYGEILEIAESVAWLVRQGDLERAARIFVAYWGGSAAWTAMSESQRATIVARIVTVPRHFEALFGATWSAPVLARLTMPILLLQGRQTRAPAQRIASILSDTLPHLQRRVIEGAGHLGPMTHAASVNTAILRHLADNGLRCGFVSAMPTRARPMACTQSAAGRNA
jgi:pimeloyl-ACP methyl ester carboxylesterase